MAGKFKARRPRSARMRGPLLAFLAESAIFGIFLLMTLLSFAQTPANRTQEQEASASGVYVLPVQGNVYMLTGAGGNIALQTGKDGLVLVDTGLADNADQTLAAIRTVSKDPIRFIINTDADRDHVGGNAAISNVATTIADNNFLADVSGSSVFPGAKIVSHLAVLKRMSSPDGDRPATPEAGWPSDEYSTKEKK